MKNFLSVATLLALTALGSLRADDSLWPPPPLSGAPPATNPAPRIDWVYRFQSNLQKYKGQHDMIWEGDSITDFWQAAGHNVWTEHFGKISIADFGISGDQVQHLLWRVQHGQLDGQDPKLVMIMIGTNNHGQDPKDVAAGIKMLIGEYETRCPQAQILLLAIFPRGVLPTDPLRQWVGQVNAIISGYGSDPRVTYVDIGNKFLLPDGTLSKDIMPDALHPNATGYEIWANAITPYVAKFFPDQVGPTTPQIDATTAGAK